MGAYNTLCSVHAACPSCSSSVTIDVQFKYGETWQHSYLIGESIRWGKNNVGSPDEHLVVLDATAGQACPICGFDGDWDFYVFVECNKLKSIMRADGKFDFLSTNEPYLVLRGKLL
jgi:hypothetical protein